MIRPRYAEICSELPPVILTPRGMSLDQHAPPIASAVNDAIRTVKRAHTQAAKSTTGTSYHGQQKHES